MARHGITYDDVISAANTLKAQGKSVTIENIRNFLGTGSSGTVNQHLRRWKEAQQTTQKIALKENLPEGLVALVKGLWEGVVTQSTEQFTPIEANYQQEITELKAELEKYRVNNQRWQKMFNQWQQEKTTLANEKVTLEQALGFAHKENQSLHGKYDVLLQQLQEKQERIEELHRLHQQTQANLEHYRESAREQRLLDQQQFENEKQQLQLEIKSSKERLISQQHTYSELYQEHQIKERSYAELEKKHHQILQSIDKFKFKVTELEKENVVHQKTSQHWQNQFNELNAKYENKLAEVISLQSDSKVINSQLIDLKQLFRDVKDQNKLIANEKLEMIQEKARLEGQIKQMQKMITV
jgi:chromosome segregation ATPase